MSETGVNATVLRMGENTPLSATRLSVSVPTHPLVALLVGTDGLLHDRDDLLHGPGATAAGVRLDEHGIGLDLTGVPDAVGAVLCVALRETGTATASVTDGAGTALATFACGELGAQRAVVVVEIYRRAGGWRLRAVGQGYEGGLAAATAAHGLTFIPPTATPPAATPPTATPPAATPPTATPPAATPPADDDIARRVRGIWEDATRSDAAHEGACSYAGDRREHEVAALLDDPTHRASAATNLARREADARHDELIGRATARHADDVGQLVGELAALEAVLPRVVARFSAPAWTPPHHPDAARAAIRVGEVHSELTPSLRVPLLVDVPLHRPLWIDTQGAAPGAGTRMVRGLLLRLLVAHGAGGLRVRAVDLAGDLDVPPAAGGLTAVLDEALRRVGEVTMCAEAGVAPADPARRLLVLHGLPYGLTETGLAQLHTLVVEGPDAGVHLIISGDGDDLSGPSADGALSTLSERTQRLPAGPGTMLVDPWVGRSWSFRPDPGPDDDAARTLFGWVDLTAG